MISRSRLALVPLLGALALVGCTPAGSTPSARPPFRVAQWGAGFEMSAPGRKLQLLDRDTHEPALRYRVTNSSVRVYTPEAVRLGKIRVSETGWRVERGDGTPFGSLGVEGGDATLLMDAHVITLRRRDGAWVVRSQQAEVARVTALEGGGWQLVQSGLAAPTAQFSDGLLSVRTHADARRWLEPVPSVWPPDVLLLTQVMLPGLEGASLELARAALAFAAHRIVEG